MRFPLFFPFRCILISIIVVISSTSLTGGFFYQTILKRRDHDHLSPTTFYYFSVFMIMSYNQEYYSSASEEDEAPSDELLAHISMKREERETARLLAQEANQNERSVLDRVQSFPEDLSGIFAPTIRSPDDLFVAISKSFSDVISNRRHLLLYKEFPAALVTAFRRFWPSIALPGPAASYQHFLPSAYAPSASVHKETPFPVLIEHLPTTLYSNPPESGWVSVPFESTLQYNCGLLLEPFYFYSSNDLPPNCPMPDSSSFDNFVAFMGESIAINISALIHRYYDSGYGIYVPPAPLSHLAGIDIPLNTPPSKRASRLIIAVPKQKTAITKSISAKNLVSKRRYAIHAGRISDSKNAVSNAGTPGHNHSLVGILPGATFSVPLGEYRRDIDKSSNPKRMWESANELSAQSEGKLAPLDAYAIVQTSVRDARDSIEHKRKRAEAQAKARAPHAKARSRPGAFDCDDDDDTLSLSSSHHEDSGTEDESPFQRAIMLGRSEFAGNQSRHFRRWKERLLPLTTDFPSDDE